MSDSYDKNLYEVQIAGIALKLRSAHGQEIVDQLVHLVDKKVQEVQSRGQNISFQSALLLASLHLAEDLVLLKQAARVELEAIHHQAREILSDLENSPISRIRLDN